MKKMLLLLMCFTLLSSLIVIGPARAAPTADEAQWMVSSKISAYDKALENSYKGQFGLYYNLYYLVLATRWTDFMFDHAGTNGIGFSIFEKDDYRTRLIQNYKAFNRKFKTSPPEDSDLYFIPLELTAKSEVKEFKSVVLDSINEKIPAYLAGRLKDINSKLKAATSEEDKATIMEEQKDNLRYIYKIVDVLVNEKLEIELIAPEGSTPYTTGSPKTKTLITDVKEYQDLLAKGRELDEKDTGQLDQLEMPDADTYVERLAYVSKKTASEASSNDLGATVWKIKDGESGPNGTFKLRDEYIRMLSASSVYRPLVSHVGDVEFLEAMGSLFTQEQRADALQLYDEVKDYRKPLYIMYDTSSKNWFKSGAFGVQAEGDGNSSLATFTAQASPIKLKDFMKNVENEKLSAMVVMKGKLETSATDSNSYFYFSDNPKFDLSADAGTVAPAPAPEANQDVVGGEEQSEENTSEEEDVDSDAEVDVETETDAEAGETEELPTSESKDYKKGNNIISAAGENMTSKNWTSAVVEVGGASNDGWQYFNAVTTMTMLKNIYKDHKYLADLPEKSNSFLYINAFGDIVTDDNLIVLPGVANPMLYEKDKGYNPYTVSFMTGYPGVNEQASTMTLGSENDRGKYVLLAGENKAEETSTWVKIKEEDSLAITTALSTVWINRKLAEPIQGLGDPFLQTELDGSLTGFMNGAKSVGNRVSNWNNWFSTNIDGAKLIKKQDAVIDGVSLMSYDPDSDVEYRIAKYLARNTYSSFRVVGNQVSDTFNDTLRQDFIFRNIMVEALNGTVNTTAYVRKLTENLANINEESYGFFMNIAKGWAQDTLGSMGNTDGILGVKDSRQDPLFGKILDVTDKIFLPLIIALFLIFLFRYMRSSVGPLWALSMVIIALGVVFVFLKIIPTYLPTAYNVALNNMNRDISYNILSIKSEKYMDTYKNSGALDEDGRFKLSTASMNLYRMDAETRKQVLDQYKITPEDTYGGKIFVIDDKTGLYLEGSNLKVNLDTLMYGNPITGSYSDSESGYLYQLNAEKMTSSVLDYYVPYYQIEQGFIDTLNNLLQVYEIPRYSAQYGGGLTKDSFLVYNYMNSMPFLLPGDYEPKTDLQAADPNFAAESDKLYALFDNPDVLTDSNDFLNLNALLSNPTPQMQETLWWRTLVQNKIIVSADKATEEDILRYDRFIESVNYLVKKFMLDLKPQVGLMSDENVIKVISIYATTIFNQKASDIGNMMYPHYINYEDFTLADVYLAAFTTERDRFLVSTGDITDYIATNSDAGGMFALTANIISGVLISNLIKFSLPVLFVALGILLFFRFIWNLELKTPLMGYAKVSVIIFGCLTIFVSSFGWLSEIKLTLAIWVMFVLYLVIALILLTTFFAVISNFTEFGNSKINSMTSDIMSKLRLDGFKDWIKAKTKEFKSGNSARNLNPIERDPRFRINADLSEMHDRDIIDIGRSSRNSRVGNGYAGTNGRSMPARNSRSESSSNRQSQGDPIRVVYDLEQDFYQDVKDVSGSQGSTTSNTSRILGRARRGKETDE